VRVEDICAPPTNDVADAGTDLNAAFDRVAQQSGAVRAVLLVSDGDWNAGVSPVTAAHAPAPQSRSPCSPWTAGSDQFLPDLDLQAVSAQAYGLMERANHAAVTIQSH